MGDVNASALIHADQHAEIKTPTKSQGTLKADGKERTFFAYAETESVSQGVSEFLGEINEQPDLPDTLLADHTFVEITQETIEIETEILHLFEELGKPESCEKEALPKEALTDSARAKSQTPKNGETKSLPGGLQQAQSAKTPDQPVVYTSLFSLAHSFNKGLSEARKTLQGEQQQTPGKTREETRPNHSMSFSTPETSEHNTFFSDAKQDRQDQEQDEDQREGFGGQQDQRQQQEEEKKRRERFSIKASRSVKRTQASRETSGGGSSASQTNRSLGSIENIYVRFMALMARILGQAEAEAHDLYMRIKERTDSIDLLTLLVSKINSEKGAIDWSNNEEMKQLIEKARALGVDIPQGKLKWTEDEKKLFKENIQMRKDSMEKVTQLERTDMQRYLQEASQCHQARSNVLKLLKEVMDTIIHNMRP